MVPVTLDDAPPKSETEYGSHGALAAQRQDYLGQGRALVEQ